MIFLNPFVKQITPGLSLCTACMNREDMLEKALQSWTKFSEIDEIIIVDWSSDKPLNELVEKYQDGRIFLARCEGLQNEYIPTIANNLSVRLSSRDTILRIDSDILLYDDFFRKHTLKGNDFWTGDWKKAKNENDKSLNGTVLIKREDFFSVNGYNERLRLYGWDDDDLYDRLLKKGFKRKVFYQGAIEHMPHSGRMPLIELKAIATVLDKYRSRITVRKNRLSVVNTEDWSDEFQLADFKVEDTGKNLMTAETELPFKNEFPWEIIRLAKIYALDKIVMDTTPHFINYEALNYDDLEKIYDFYVSNEHSPENIAVLKLLTGLLESNFLHASRPFYIKIYDMGTGFVKAAIAKALDLMGYSVSDIYRLKNRFSLKKKTTRPRMWIAYWMFKTGVLFGKLFQSQIKQERVEKYLDKMIKIQGFKLNSRVGDKIIPEHFYKPVLIYQVGKVASTTLTVSLKRFGFKNVYKIHHYQLENIIKNVLDYFHKDSHYTASEGYFFQKNSIMDSAKIIVPIREPVSRSVSSFFFLKHNLKQYKNDNINSNEKIKQEILNKKHLNAQPMWFENEFKKSVGKSIYELPFDKNKGYHITKANGLEILLLKVEIPDGLKIKALEEFLCIDNFRLVHKNRAKQHNYFPKYNKFKKDFKLSKEALSEIYSNRFYRKFYSEQEIDSFIKQWMADD